MIRFRNAAVIAVMLAGLCLTAADAAAQVDLSPDMRAMLSRLQSMGHGYHSAEEWREMFRDLDAVAGRAEQAGRIEEVIEANLLRAMVYSDMLGEYNSALDVLSDLKRRYGRMQLVGVRKIYVRQAEVYAKLGDEDAIKDLIREFKTSPHFDAAAYPYSGGQGRDVPLTLTRPGATRTGSLTVTAMEKALGEARFAPGRPCPAFRSVDSDGNPVSPGDYAGRVLLIDFWMSGWGPWRAELPQLVEIHRAYNRYGFEILGVSLEANQNTARLVASQSKLPWRMVYGDRATPGLFGLYGEASNFLVDEQGAIVGRNLKGSDLIRAIRDALGME